MAVFLGYPKVQFFKSGSNEFLAGGKLFSYVSGTTTPMDTYATIADADAATNANTNPIILDSRGEAVVVVTGASKFVLKDEVDAVIWTVDNYNPPAAASITTFDTITANQADIANNLNVGGIAAITGAITGASVTVTGAVSGATLAASGAATVGSTLGVTGVFTARSVIYPSNVSTANQVLANTNGTGTTGWVSVLGNVVIQTFTSSGTYTPTAGMIFADIEVQGAGGGGGGASAASSEASVARGGASGGYAKSRRTAAVIGATATVAIGAAGTAGTSAPESGGQGGTSSVAMTGTGTITISATGGSGGTAGSSGTAMQVNGSSSYPEGVSTNSDIAYGTGTPGENGIRFSGTVYMSGGGASSRFGVGTIGVTSVGNVTESTGYGSGGQGAASVNGVAYAGRAGRAGIVVITEYVR